MNTTYKYIAVLRGINVGGHHKVPMAQLSKEMIKLGYENIITILNSGNIIFDASIGQEKALETTISEHLEKVFGFSIPVMVRKGEIIADLIKNNPFEHIQTTKDTRFYISFLMEKPTINLEFPWTSDDGAYRILETRDRLICSVLDLALTQTTKGMENLERLFGKDITTRNWNTINRINTKIS